MISVKNNRLYVGDLAASDLAKRFGSPVYVYDEETIRSKVKVLIESITYRPFRIYYAAKANTNLAILKLIRDEGNSMDKGKGVGVIGIDAVSPGEIEIALMAGFKPQDIIFTSTSVTDEEMRFAIGRKVLVNCDSLSQLERYGRLNPNSKVCFRVNPDVGAGHHGHVITGGPESKFGIWVNDVAQAFGIAAKYNLKIVGIHEHIGSGILETEKFLAAMKVLLSIINRNRGKLKDLEFVDFGGGIGVPYRPDQKPINFKEFGAAVSRLFTDFCSSFGKNPSRVALDWAQSQIGQGPIAHSAMGGIAPKSDLRLALAIEPGRFIVAESGLLLCTVNTVKQTPAHKFVGVDTGFNHLIRPMAYGSYHPILVVDKCNSNAKEKVAVCGNVCESGDVFTRNEGGIVDRELPKIKEGDVLAILVAGAYGFSMASTYNTRPRPPEVLVSGRDVRVIRKRETLTQVIYGM